ncbi:MAG: lipoprotein [Desulfovibrio sp.]|nr:lipoprotein [Desulfovibrio sp.]
MKRPTDLLFAILLALMLAACAHGVQVTPRGSVDVGIGASNR